MSDIAQDRNILNVAYQNVRGLNTKTDIFLNAVNLTSDEYEVVVLAETWINDNVYNSELFASDFVVYRKDRDSEATRKVKGGGVLIAVKSYYRSSKVELNFNDPVIDLLCVKLSINHFTHIYIFAIYIIPTCSLLSYENFYNFLENLPFLYEGNFLLIGDFNISYLNEHYVTQFTDPYIEALNNLLNFFNCIQHNRVVNNLNRILDLVVSKLNCTVIHSTFSFVDEDTYHPTLLIAVPIKDREIKSLPSISKNYNFKKANYDAMYLLFSNIDWTGLELLTDVNEAVALFYSKIYAIFDVCVPKIMQHKQYPVWFTKKIIKDLKHKDKLRQLSIRTNDIELRNRYVNLRAQTKKDIDIAYKQYLREIQQNISHDSKTFWHFMNNKRSSVSIPSNMKFNDMEYSNGESIANAFASYFKSVYIDNDSDDDNDFIKHNVYTHQISVLSVEEQDIVEAVKTLKINKAIGPDNLPSYIIKGCIDFLIYPLKFIFNLSLSTKMFPDVWKEAKICPIFKKGDKADIKNYRPIAVLPAPAKLFESILYKFIYVSVYGIISQHQHGFMKCRSTISNLSNITQFISEVLDQRSQVDVIYTDFAKAFDTVSHSVLLTRLHREFGFHSNLVQLMASYLQNRKQIVVVGGYFSKPFVATSGVPQGSNLGPLLFLLFIDSITKEINSSRYLLFADDIKIYARIDHVNDCSKLQEDINNIFKWSTSNKLSLNINKCNVLTFTRKKETIIYQYNIGGAVLERVNEVRDLGVVFDSKLTFNKHITSITNKASKMYGFIVRNTRHFTQINCIKQLYVSFVRSILEYASVIWSPHYQCHVYSLEKIQNRFLRYVHFKNTGQYDWNIPKNHILEFCNLQTLEKRRQINNILYLYKLLHADVDDSDFLSLISLNVPSHSTRSLNTFYISGTPHTNIHLNSPLYKICNSYNTIQTNCDIFDVKYKTLRRLLNETM